MARIFFPGMPIAPTEAGTTVKPAPSEAGAASAGKAPPAPPAAAKQ
jgi:hypothetical protein